MTWIQPFFWSTSCYVWSIVIILCFIEKTRRWNFQREGSIIIFLSSYPKFIFIPCCFWKCWRFWCIDYIHHDVDWQFLKKMRLVLSWNWPFPLHRNSTFLFQRYFSFYFTNLQFSKQQSWKIAQRNHPQIFK